MTKNFVTLEQIGYMCLYLMSEVAAAIIEIAVPIYVV